MKRHRQTLDELPQHPSPVDSNWYGRASDHGKVVMRLNQGEIARVCTRFMAGQLATNLKRLKN